MSGGQTQPLASFRSFLRPHLANLNKLTDRFIRRCEVQRFDATSDEFRDGMVDVVREVWKRETGTDLD